jgi:hypothetical protein
VTFERHALIKNVEPTDIQGVIRSLFSLASVELTDDECTFYAIQTHDRILRHEHDERYLTDINTAIPFVDPAVMRLIEGHTEILVTAFKRVLLEDLRDVRNITLLPTWDMLVYLLRARLQLMRLEEIVVIRLFMAFLRQLEDFRDVYDALVHRLQTSRRSMRRLGFDVQEVTLAMEWADFHGMDVILPYSRGCLGRTIRRFYEGLEEQGRPQREMPCLEDHYRGRDLVHNPPDTLTWCHYRFGSAVAALTHFFRLRFCQINAAIANNIRQQHCVPTGMAVARSTMPVTAASSHITDGVVKHFLSSALRTLTEVNVANVTADVDISVCHEITADTLDIEYEPVQYEMGLMVGGRDTPSQVYSPTALSEKVQDSETFGSFRFKSSLSYGTLRKPKTCHFLYEASAGNPLAVTLLSTSGDAADPVFQGFLSGFRRLTVSANRWQIEDATSLATPTGIDPPDGSMAQTIVFKPYIEINLNCPDPGITGRSTSPASSTSSMPKRRRSDAADTTAAHAPLMDEVYGDGTANDPIPL